MEPPPCPVVWWAPCTAHAGHTPPSQQPQHVVGYFYCYKEEKLLSSFDFQWFQYAV